jgi:ribose/xylose/arabinose/galactoside ABC-type transport system permease subunit
LVVAIVVGVLVGIIVGLINGALIAYMGVNPFIASLGMMAIVRGLVMGITDARPISEWNESFSFLGTKSVGIIPLSTIFLIVLIIGAELFLRHTRRGRYIYVYGSNSEAGYLAGINMKSVLLTAYIFCGATAAIAGIWLAARLNTGSPVIADDAALIAITAVILGGTSLTGGSGSVLKTAIGIMILGLMSNLMNLMEVASYYQILTKGLLVVIVVAFDAPGLKKLLKKISNKKH